MNSKKTNKPNRSKILKALHAESALRERQQILDLLALPPHKRTHFLRVRFSWGGSAL
jgi:hypothetical protein